MGYRRAAWKPVSCALVAALAVCGVAHADDTADADGTWAARAQLGYSKTAGNTDTSSLNGLFHIAHTTQPWKFLFGVDGYYGATGGQTTAQSWDAYLQANYNISERFYWFAKLSETQNKFSGFAYQDIVSTGGGYQLIKTDATKLSVQIGVGERRLKPLLDLTLSPIGAIESYSEGSTEIDTVADGKVSYEHSFNALTKIIAVYEIDTGMNNTLQSGNLSLQVKMAERLGLTVSYSLVTNSHPPPGIGRSASLESLSLTYALKNKKLAPE